MTSSPPTTAHLTRLVMSGTRTGKEVGVRALGRPLPGTERFVSEVEEAQGGVSADREAELNMGDIQHQNIYMI